MTIEDFTKCIFPMCDQETLWKKKTSQSNPDATSRNQKAGDWLIYILLMLHLHTLAWERLQDAQRQTCTNTVAGSKNSNIWIHMAHDKLDGCRITSEMSIHNLCVWTPNKPEAQVCRFWFWMQAGFWWTETLSGHLERKAHVWCHTTTMRLEFVVGLVSVGPLKNCEVSLLHDRPLDSTTRALPDTAQSKSTQTRSLKRVRLQVQFRSP